MTFQSIDGSYGEGPVFESRRDEVWDAGARCGAEVAETNDATRLREKQFSPSAGVHNGARDASTGSLEIDNSPWDVPRVDGHSAAPSRI